MTKSGLSRRTVAANDDVSAADERAAILSRTRSLKMARSQHAYVRGSTVKFYEWLAESGGKVPAGPSIWICGDCHLGNLGPLADTNGKVEIQIRDLDQTVIGNPAHDLIRLALSLAAAARGFDLPGATTARMIEAIINGYLAGLARHPNVDDEDQPEAVRKLLRVSTRRRWKHLAEDRIGDVSPTIPLGPKFWALERVERQALVELLDASGVADQLRMLADASGEGPIELLDAAYWVKGCSSLGRQRYAAIVRLGKRARPSLLDIKEATKAAAPRDTTANMPRDNAARVVTGAQALSPHLGERMFAARLGETAVVVRELMPQDLKIELEYLTSVEAQAVARSLAAVVGIAHGRQMDAHHRAEWAADLTRQRSKTLDAPSWLWTSVVELVGVHESAYLEHCRRALLAT